MRGRGRMRKRGLSGGGTLRRKSPQQGQRPSSAIGPVASARSQWPRASHNGLMHCTVKPGKYCMRTPSVASQLRGHMRTQVRQKLPWAARTELLERILPFRACGVKRKDYKRLWWGCQARCGKDRAIAESLRTSRIWPTLASVMTGNRFLKVRIAAELLGLKRLGTPEEPRDGFSELRLLAACPRSVV